MRAGYQVYLVKTPSGSDVDNGQILRRVRAMLGAALDKKKYENVKQLSYNIKCWGICAR